MNVFEAVKQSVTTRQAAELYGINVNRAGKANCPFHNDRTPSMKVDKRFHCFGCGADGDVIDFTAQLYGLDAKSAAEKLAADFQIPYTHHKRKETVKKAIREKSEEKMYRELEARCFRVLSDYFHLLRHWERAYAPKPEDETWHPLFVEALQKKDHIPYVLHHFLGAEICAYGTEVMRLFLLGAIHRVFRPGCKFELMLCLVGGQGAGKSTFFRFLACKDEWFSDDLKKIDDDNVFRKMQGHWIIEMSEMIATANARSIEDIKSFLSRSKETYKVPYATEPEDRLRQCVFGGTSNALDFLPLDRSGNRRFLPIMVHPEQAEVHILEDEAASRQYMDQLWAEAMTLYRRGKVQLKLSKEMNEQLVLLQKQFMPEDTKVGVIQAFLDDFNGDMVCITKLWDALTSRNRGRYGKSTRL